MSAKCQQQTPGALCYPAVSSGDSRCLLSSAALQRSSKNCRPNSRRLLARRITMPLNCKGLAGTLAMVAIAVVTITPPVFAQQGAPAAGQEPPSDVQSPSGPPPNDQQPDSPPPQSAQVRPGPARPALVIANVNLRRGPGTDSEIITTIPGGSTVRITSCSGEWCAVTWNGLMGFAVARTLDTGGPRQARQYRAPPGYDEDADDELGPPVVYGAPPPVVYGPGYFGPGYYGGGWRRRW